MDYSPEHNPMTKFVFFAVVGLCSMGFSAHAQHLDVLIQVVDGKLVTGAANYDNNTWLVGQKVYKRQLLSNFRTPDPGFTGLETGNPLLEGGVVGLTPNIDLVFDIIPTTIEGQRANFWYWEGVDPDEDGFDLADVEFDLAPAGVTWNVFDQDFQLHTADGSDTVVPGALIQETFSDGAVHNHLVMQVADGDGNSQTDPPEGIYLSAMVLRADGFEDSEPYLFVHRTSGLTNEPRDIAATWVIENYDLLVGEAMPGDFNESGTVEGTDFLIWQRDLGTPEELMTWENNYAANALSTQTIALAVPEPTTLVSAVMILVSFVVCGRDF